MLNLKNTPCASSNRYAVVYCIKLSRDRVIRVTCVDSMCHMIFISEQKE